MGLLGKIGKAIGGAVGGVTSLIGLGISAYSQYKEGQDAKDVYEYNQAIAEYRAKYVEEAAELEIEALNRDVSDYVSRQRVIQGKSGTVANIGSNLESIKRTYSERDIDAGLIRWRADKDAELLRMGGDLFGEQGRQFGRAGTINAVTTLLGGASKWDWKTSQLSTPYYRSPPVPAFSGYTPGR